MINFDFHLGPVRLLTAPPDTHAVKALDVLVLDRNGKQMDIRPPWISLAVVDYSIEVGYGCRSHAPRVGGLTISLMLDEEERAAIYSTRRGECQMALVQDAKCKVFLGELLGYRSISRGTSGEAVIAVKSLVREL